MKQILVCCFIFTNLIEVALPASSLASIFEKCRSKEPRSMRWWSRVTIGEEDDPPQSQRHQQLNNNDVITTSTPNGTSEGPNKTSESSRNGFLSRLLGMINEILRVPAEITIRILNAIKTIWETPTRINQRIDAVITTVFKSVCSIIPEPITIPDVNLTTALRFRAVNGSISGIRRMCEGRSFVPEIRRKGVRVGVKQKLKLEGLHFEYHVIDERLGVNHIFNWTLAAGSGAEMYIMAGYSFPCVLRIEDVDVNMDFDGKDGGHTCTGDCKTILSRLKCYLYHSLVYVIKETIKPLKFAAADMWCISLKRAVEQEANG